MLPGSFSMYDGYIEGIAGLVGGYTGKATGYHVFVDHRNDTNNHLLDDEINLWTRMKYDNKKQKRSIKMSIFEEFFIKMEFYFLLKKKKN